MKITCQSCQAKYTIADEKVLGKIVKIRCKKCSATIVVNGSDNSTNAGPAALSGAEDGWMVNVADGDQRTMTDAEIVSAYQAGVVGTETFCWKDGMSDWLPLREIDGLYDACSATRAIQPSEPPGDGQTRIQPDAAGYAAAADHEHAAPPSYGSNGNAAPAAAARRVAGGRAPAADLFRGAARAGSEEEVMTSAPAGTPQAFDEQKPTGARNENSVLFSLNALTSKGNDRPPAVPGVEASGLIDIRQLSAQMGKGDDKKRSRVDDIMNLSSGGAFNGAMSAPMLSAPALDQYGPPAGADAGGAPGAGKSKWLIFLALAAGAVVVICAIGAAVVMMRGSGTDADKGAASAKTASAASSSASVAAPVESPTAATATAPTEPTAPTAAAATTDTAAATAAATTAAPTTAAPAVAAAPVAQATPHAAAPAAAPRPAPAAASEGDQPFNMGEAKSRLAAAAAAVQSCKKADGPAGTGRVVVVFAPSGGAQTATLAGPPFDGTPTGACVAARFRGVHVPPFSGSPFSVSKSFTIN